jgi:hypothetical protein
MPDPEIGPGADVLTKMAWLLVPSTCSRCWGEVVPMPTLPVEGKVLLWAIAESCTAKAVRNESRRCFMLLWFKDSWLSSRHRCAVKASSFSKTKAVLSPF